MKLRNLTPNQRIEYLQKTRGVQLSHIPQASFPIEQVEGTNCENPIGVTQIPLGITSPIELRITNYELRKQSQQQQVFVPLATTEGALVASVSRGCKAITQSGGCEVMVEDVGTTRGPYIRVKSLQQAQELLAWIDKHWSQLEETVKQSSRYCNLKKYDWWLVGKTLYLRFVFYTGEAMGMNMVTIATQRILDLISKQFSVQTVVSSNVCVDKKPAFSSLTLGRGKKVWAEVTISEKVIKLLLKTTAKEMVEVVRLKQQQGSTLSGSIGSNAHAANIAAAFFIATGQDPAHVVEASLTMTTAELDGTDLYMAIHMPSVMVGTIGGGTGLPTQQEALQILGLGQPPQSGDSLTLAGILAGSVLAGEISLTASLARGSLGRAHQVLGRRESSSSRTRV
jgi:hydroxymethylglutaryl-CoA reductase (NADPH)